MLCRRARSSRSLRGGIFSHAAELLEIFGIEDMRLDPALKRVALAGNGVPRLVKAVVAFVVAMRVRWRSAARDATDCGECPARQNARIRPCFQVIHDLFDGDD